MTEEQLRRLKEAAEISKKLLEDEEKRLRDSGGRSDQLERSLAVEKEKLKIIEAQYRLREKDSDQAEKQAQLTKELEQTLKNVQGVLTETEGSADSFSSSMSRALDKVKNLRSPLNLAVKAIASIANETKKAVIEVDRVRAGFVGITADASDAMRMAERLTLSNLDLAISFDEMSKSQVQLRTQFAQFGFLSDRVRESVTLQAAQLQKLGVDAGTTASIMNTLTMSFGQSAAEAAVTQRQIIGLGQALKIPPGIIARDFAQALPHLAQFGNRAVQVFEELSVAARQAGVSVSDLTGVFGDQFNTFEGAVGAAGRLNQALRSDVFSGMELLMADTAERQRMIKEGLRLSGMEFQNLERYEKLYIANALGIRDVAQAAAILGDTQADVAMRIGDTSFSMAEMEDMAKRATATVDKMKFIFMQLAVVVTPLVDAFANVIQGTLNITAPMRASMTPVGDTSMPGGATQIVSGGQVFQPSSNDTVVAAQEGGILANELKEIKNAIKGMNGGIGKNTRIVLEVPGLSGPLETKIKDVMDDRIHGFA